ncbi:hypothetical protein CYY_004795 [Polysphondylium violaceum]|uniref:NlpC/P60 domain-containing protein n=1 Tax=Polysphondylium violaceum TaxID=133409 RepID=A0A8J4V4T9_9MYCE|nr:hypothetical protein CYY_004795 [Polysphondylium violaceum]
MKTTTLIFYIFALVTVPIINAITVSESINKLLQVKRSVPTQPLSVCITAAAIAKTHKYCNCWEVQNCPCNANVLDPLGLITKSFAKSGLDIFSKSLPACGTKMTPGTYVGSDSNACNTWKVEIPISGSTSGGQGDPNIPSFNGNEEISTGNGISQTLIPKTCDPSNISNCQVGDLFFYCATGSDVCPSHVAMNVGDNLIAECPVNSYQCNVREPYSENSWVVVQFVSQNKKFEIFLTYEN